MWCNFSNEHWDRYLHWNCGIISDVVESIWEHSMSVHFRGADRKKSLLLKMWGSLDQQGEGQGSACRKNKQEGLVSVKRGWTGRFGLLPLHVFSLLLSCSSSPNSQLVPFCIILPIFLTFKSKIYVHLTWGNDLIIYWFLKYASN